jgi:hypothetical protein
MSTLLTRRVGPAEPDILAEFVSFDYTPPRRMRVRLTDGTEIVCPLDRFPRLAIGTPEQLKNWRLIGYGLGIHWEDLDEDLSVQGLLREAREQSTHTSQKHQRRTLLDRLKRTLLNVRQSLLRASRN